MNRKSSQSHPVSWWLVVVAGGLVVVFSIAIVREIVRTRQIRRQLAQLRTDIAGEQQRHQQLQELIAYLSSPTFQEREARLQLGLKKSGERVIVVPGSAETNTNGSATSIGTPAGSNASSSTPAKWWQYFFPTDLHKTGGTS